MQSIPVDEQRTHVMRTLLALTIILVLIVIYTVPFMVYAGFTLITDLRTPEGTSPGRFLVSVLISKAGVSIAFVLIYHHARTALNGRWFWYSSIWLVMLIYGEIGQVLLPSYSWTEAIAGIISEVIYLPLSGYIVHRLLRNTNRIYEQRL
jgi:hypothetical protein